jgi:hypothetical protein
MKFESIKARLRVLTERRGGTTALLKFPDGSSRALKIRSRQTALELCLDCFQKLSCYPPEAPPQMPEGNPTPAPPRLELETKNDKVIALLGNAESVAGDHFLQFIHELAKDLSEKKSPQRKEKKCLTSN